MFHQLPGGVLKGDVVREACAHVGTTQGAPMTPEQGHKLPDHVASAVA